MAAGAAGLSHRSYARYRYLLDGAAAREIEEACEVGEVSHDDAVESKGQLAAGGGGGGDSVIHITLVGQDGSQLAETITVRQKQNENLDDTPRVRMPVGLLSS